MYPEQKMTTADYAGGAASTGNRLGAIQAAVASPIQSRLMEQESLLSQLGQEIDRLANSVATVMQDDPRNQTSKGIGEVCAPVSCQLESKISDANAIIAANVSLLSQICKNIQL